MSDLQAWLAATAKQRQAACKAERKQVKKDAGQAARAAAWWKEYRAKQAASKG